MATLLAGARFGMYICNTKTKERRMNREQVLAAAANTTEKMLALFELGCTLTEVRRLLGVRHGAAELRAFRGGRRSVLLTGGVTRRASRPQVVAAPAPAVMFTPAAFNRKFGVEIEAYGATREAVAAALNAAGVACQVESYNHETRPMWKVVTDGSLSGENTFELVSPPLTGMAGMAEVETVCYTLEAIGAKVNRSCGLHVHMDAQAMDFAAVRSTVANYARLEAQIDAVVPPSRRSNGYCRSIAPFVANVEAAANMDALSRVFPGRYHKVNTEAWLRHKTVEFRQAGGTVEAQKVCNWLTFLHNLMAYSEAGHTATAATPWAAFNQPQLVAWLNMRRATLAGSAA